MNTESTTTLRRLRVLLAALAMFLASTLFGGVAVADLLRPNTEIGAPGGGGGSAVTLEDTTYSDTIGARPF